MSEVKTERDIIQPNFEAYARYTQLGQLQGVNVVEGGQKGTRDDYLIIQWDKFRGLGDKETGRLADEFMSVARDGRYQGDFSTDQELRDGFARQVKEVQNGEVLGKAVGGGVSSPSQKVSYLDSQGSDRDFSSNRLFGGRIYADSAKEKNLDALFVREHEVAHQILGLNEAGADYVAAARMRQLYPGPETDAFLQREADMRAVRPFRVQGAILVDDQKNYGAGCTDAIQAVLKTDPAKMKEAFESGDFYYDALKFDEQNERLAESRPDKNVRVALRMEKRDVFDKDYAVTDLRQTAKFLLDKGVFPKDSDEHHVLVNLEAATARADTALKQYATPPAVSPTPATVPQPAATPPQI